MIVLFVIGLGAWRTAFPADAQDLKTKAEAEGKLMFYATFTAADGEVSAANGGLLSGRGFSWAKAGAA